MHSPIYKATEIRRESVVQELRVIEPPCEDAPAGSVRVVQLCIPLEPQVVVGVDVRVEDVGPNRQYKLAVLPPGAQIRFHLLPHQFLIAGAGIGRADLTVIVEHHKG